MKLEAFTVDPDLVGGRIRVWWDLVPEADGELGQPVRTVLRRKTRDFEFPVNGGGDPFVIFDSNAFPPAGSQASVVPGWESRSGANRIVTTVDSAWVERNGLRVEILRRTTYTTFGPDGKPVRRRIEILDSGSDASPVEANTAYYYRLSIPSPGLKVNGSTQGVAISGGVHGLGRRMYHMLPEIYRRYDVVMRPVTPGADAIVEAAPGSELQGRFVPHGQLRRFIDLFGVALDFMRSRAEGLRDLLDVDECEYRLLPLMANWLAWDLSFDASIPIQRHEIRYAAALYRITGTIPGCMVWVRRLTGWRGQIKEFAHNVFFTNKPDSTSLDTANAQTVANLHKFEDQSHYTYDAGSGDDHWFAYNAIGIFVSPDVGESSEVVKRKVGKLRNHLNLMLPFNVRGVVILSVQDQKAGQASAVNLGARSTDQVQ